MGKNLKGKELGKGLSQRKDGLYSARFVNQDGKRVERYFSKLSDARSWLKSDKIDISEPVRKTMTVNEWFEFWRNNLICDLAPNTIRNYTERYKFNIQPVIGSMDLRDVKPMHCKQVLNAMEKAYAASTMGQTYICMGVLFRAAVNNDLIEKHPLTGVKINKPKRALDDIHFLTVEEQERFLEQAKESHNYRQYALLLETGLRTSELIGLTWDSVDWENRTLSVTKTLEYRHSTKVWRAGPTKTKASYRTIPITDTAYDILRSCYDEKDSRKESTELASMELDYLDRRSGSIKKLCMHDVIFVNWRTGWPAKNSSYDTHLYKLCDEAGLDHFCMHALRHTYATRAIERGVQPKVLQKLLGHASIKTTMDRYVHVTNQSLVEGVRQFMA